MPWKPSATIANLRKMMPVTCLLLVIFQKAVMLKIRMEFDLIDRRWDRARFKDPIEMFLKIVAYANRFSEALGFELLHLLPLLLMVFLLVAEEGHMNQIPSTNPLAAHSICKNE